MAATDGTPAGAAACATAPTGLSERESRPSYEPAWISSHSFW
jgi:hypothetical protein